MLLDLCIHPAFGHLLNISTPDEKIRDYLDIFQYHPKRYKNILRYMFIEAFKRYNLYWIDYMLRLYPSSSYSFDDIEINPLTLRSAAYISKYYPDIASVFLYGWLDEIWTYKKGNKKEKDYYIDILIQSGYVDISPALEMDVYGDYKGLLTYLVKTRDHIRIEALLKNKIDSLINPRIEREVFSDNHTFCYAFTEAIILDDRYVLGLIIDNFYRNMSISWNMILWILSNEKESTKRYKVNISTLFYIESRLLYYIEKDHLIINDIRSMIVESINTGIFISD